MTRQAPPPAALLRIGFSVVWLATLGVVGLQLAAEEAYPADAFWQPIGAGRFLDGPASMAARATLWAVAAASTLALLAGAATRLSGAVALASSTVLLTVHHGIAKLDHGPSLGLVFLAILQFSSWGDAWSVDARRRPRPAGSARSAEAPLRAFMAVAALLYLSSALLKVWRGRFLAPGRMSDFIAGANAARGQTGAGAPAWMAGAADWLAAHPAAGDLLGLGALAIEASVAAALLARPLRVLVCGLLAGFHAGIALTTGIAFWGNAALFLLVGAVSLRPDPRPADTLGGKAFLRQAALAAAATAACLAVAAAVEGARGPPPAAVLSAWFAVGAPVRLLLPWPVVAAAALALAVAGAAQAARAVRAAARPPAPDGAERTLLYDGGCGFCRRWCDWAERRTGPGVAYRPCQDAQALRAKAGIPDAACVHAAFFVTVRGGEAVDVRRGAGAVNAVLERFPGRRRWAWRLLGAAYRLHGVRPAEDLGYRWVAANRHRLGDDACALPQPAGQPKP